MMGAKLLLLLCTFVVLLQFSWGMPSLDDIDESLSLLEEASDNTPSVESVLQEAKEYAAKQLSSALNQSKSLLDTASKIGEAEAVQLGPAPLSTEEANAAAQNEAAQKEAVQKEADAKAATVAAASTTTPVQQQAAASTSTSTTAVPSAESKGAEAAKLKRLSDFRSRRVKPNSQGVFGAVELGLSKAESVPSSGFLTHKGDRTALNRYVKGDQPKDIYGNIKSCLKDIAAHFDETDIYEAKKQSLIQKMDHAKSRAQATQIRQKLTNLETWHQMMQKKFLMSSNEYKEHQKKIQRLFDAHLPQELKDKLAANKVAKRAGQKIPFPGARKQAFAFLKTMKHDLARDSRLRKLGHKVMVRPTINNPDFPSMDHISSHLREQRWRRVHTEEKWSVDKGEHELADNLVKDAHKQHGDFLDGPIAAPMLKDKLYTPHTERLGQPNFLVDFPWPKTPDEHIRMDTKVRVEQTDHATY